MKKMKHEWGTYYSPRNGRVSIQACNQCGVAKGLVLQSHECSTTTSSLKNMRLKGWTTANRMEKNTNGTQVRSKVLMSKETMSAGSV